MPYHIQPYTRSRAKKLGVEVRPSHLPQKKLDVYQDGKLLASIGDTNYGDYPTYLKEKGKAFAEERRRAYHQRHAKDNRPAGKFSKYLLW